MYDHDGSLYALEKVDHSLHDHGELGDPPKDYGMMVKATNGHTYYVQVQLFFRYFSINYGRIFNKNV